MGIDFILFGLYKRYDDDGTYDNDKHDIYMLIPMYSNNIAIACDDIDGAKISTDVENIIDGKLFQLIVINEPAAGQTTSTTWSGWMTKVEITTELNDKGFVHIGGISEKEHK